MVTSDEKLDALQDSIIGLTFSVDALGKRLDAVDAILCKRQEAFNNIYAHMQTTNERLVKIEVFSAASGQIWNKMAPFMAVLFGAGLAALSMVLLHVYGGR
jgi:hypothetical protein